ncbi:RecB-family nuclease [Thermoproteus tenax]|uniref:RecB-family nuclease n=1 Tax=Thermoproteus tenax (strain ATCC 35583 / DSM 2078 / JCM 9277 / NBRC 100435 / Kra 1) TaxID=768679 RepID=G4RLH5_THETK|nr:RecB-family nuclease [Thermoproteus tenax]CCC82420.1 RecB-family nuclease [Thermoproteus tenax Kra 1]
MDLAVAVYNVSSLPRLMEMAKVAYGFGVKRLVGARVFGSAAQQIGDLFKYALKVGGEVLIFNDLRDAYEALRPDVVIALTRPEKGVEPLGEPPQGRTLLVVSGTDLPITPRELPQGAKLAYAVDADIGSVGQLAVALYKLKKELTRL